MDFLGWSTVIGLVAVAGFLWRLTHTLNRDMRTLETRVTNEMRKLETRVTDEMHRLSEKMSELVERVAKIEGAFIHPPVGGER